MTGEMYSRGRSVENHRFSNLAPRGLDQVHSTQKYVLFHTHPVSKAWDHDKNPIWPKQILRAS